MKNVTNGATKRSTKKMMKSSILMSAIIVVVSLYIAVATEIVEVGKTAGLVAAISFLILTLLLVLTDK